MSAHTPYTPQEGDRVTNSQGYVGTVIDVYPSQKLARVLFDQNQRGRVLGKTWHCSFAVLTKV